MAPIAYYVALVPIILMAITFHEYAHARLALWFGDETPYRQGRVTLNPLAHLDPIGTLMIFVIGFGWGRPVQVNPANFNHPRADAVVSAAGPLTNFLLAVVGSILFRIYIATEPAMNDGLSAVLLFVVLFVQINLALCFFNLIPLYPLDGSHVLENLLPPKTAWQVQAFNRRYGAAILMSLVLLGYVTRFHVFAFVLGPPIMFFRQLFLGM